jgi:NAD(P)-dependent dehydrogenase (short-subunit alcohol dehydrogenase family)
MRTDSKVALVTGAGLVTGIGFEVATQFASHGFKVFLAARRADDAEARARELSLRGLSVKGLGLDLADAAAVANAPSFVERELGPLDVLINNARPWRPMANRRLRQICAKHVR